MNANMNDPFRISLDSLEELADLIGTELQCPITIEDSQHRLLAYSKHDENTDQARVATIIGRRVPENVITQLWKEGVIPALLNTKEPVRIKRIDQIGLGDRVAISIWKREEVIGFIWAVETDHPLNDEKMNLLKSAAKAAKNELLQLQVHKAKNEDRSEEFFWRLLTGHLNIQKEISNEFRNLKINQPHAFAIVIFQFPQSLSKREVRQTNYLLKISQQIKVILHTIDGNKLILLISAPAGENPGNELEDFVKTFLRSIHQRYNIPDVRAGSSSIYENYQKVKKAYRESLTVLSIKEKFPSETIGIDYYPKLGIYLLFDVILEKYHHEKYANQSLEKIYDYDQKHNSNLAKTLEVYLDSDCSIPEAAERLIVHPNTLIYRLKRISDIGKMDFKDPKQKIMLYIDLKLKKYQQET